jgi:hypothetical protein
MEGVVSVSKSQTKIYSLHTTRSWKFVGLDGPLDHFEEKSNETNSDLLAKAKYGQDIIVGMIDCGKLCAYNYKIKNKFLFYNLKLKLSFFCLHHQFNLILGSVLASSDFSPLPTAFNK